MQSLKVENLSVSIGDNLILKNINLTINKGETVLILGPNGHGKSTLLKTILHHYDTVIKSGKIYIDDIDINNFTTDMIANKGVYLANQYPIEIPGLSMLELIRNEIQKTDQKISIIELYKIVNQKAKTLEFNNELLSRSINENFSGGERKKSEILQMEILNPDFILLDEIDSGLDVDAINIINNSLVNQKSLGKAIIYISHNDKLLSTLIPDKVVLIMNGEIVQIGDKELANKINEIGYHEYAKQIGINLKQDENKNIDYLKEHLKGFNCNGK